MTERKSSLESSSFIAHRSSLKPVPVPDRYRSSFSPATLQTLETHRARFRVSDPLFFRSAYTADVTENERRTFRPILIVSAGADRFTMMRCACQAFDAAERSLPPPRDARSRT